MGFITLNWAKSGAARGKTSQYHVATQRQTSDQCNMNSCERK